MRVIVLHDDGQIVVDDIYGIDSLTDNEKLRLIDAMLSGAVNTMVGEALEEPCSGSLNSLVESIDAKHSGEPDMGARDFQLSEEESELHGDNYPF